jgi:N-terminal half of MaoC dehydratase
VKMDPVRQKGRLERFVATEEIGRSSIRYFAVALGDTNPMWTDDAYARSHGLRGACAPPTFICETNQYMPGTPDAETGYAGFIWSLPGVRPRKTVRAAHHYWIHRPLYEDDILVVDWELTDVKERRTKSGEQAWVVTSTIRYSNQAGELLATHQEVMYHFV